VIAIARNVAEPNGIARAAADAARGADAILAVAATPDQADVIQRIRGRASRVPMVAVNLGLLDWSMAGVPTIWAYAEDRDSIAAVALVLGGEFRPVGRRPLSGSDRAGVNATEEFAAFLSEVVASKPKPVDRAHGHD
jgi:hypothetical protein